MPDGKWMYQSSLLAVKFENPKFNVCVPARYDPSDNLVKCATPPILAPDVVAQLAAIDAELKVSIIHNINFKTHISVSAFAHLRRS